MSEHIPHTTYQAPRDLGRLCGLLVRQVLCRLADDLEVPDHCIARALVGDKGVVVDPGDEASDLDAGLDDVVCVEPPVALGVTRHPPPRARPRAARSEER